LVIAWHPDIIYGGYFAIEGDGKPAAKKTKKCVSMSFGHEGEAHDDIFDPGKSLAKKAKKVGR